MAVGTVELEATIGISMNRSICSAANRREFPRWNNRVERSDISMVRSLPKERLRMKRND